MQNIDILKSLTQTTYDSVEGYRKAIDKVDSTALKSAMERRLKSREQTLSTLNTTLEGLGESRITSTSMSGTAHQTFMGIADAFKNGDEAAVERIEEGEDYIAGEFRKALDNNRFDPSMLTVVKQAAQEVWEGERFSDMLEKQYA